MAKQRFLGSAWETLGAKGSGVSGGEEAAAGWSAASAHPGGPAPSTAHESTWAAAASTFDPGRVGLFDGAQLWSTGPAGDRALRRDRGQGHAAHRARDRAANLEQQRAASPPPLGMTE